MNQKPDPQVLKAFFETKNCPQTTALCELLGTPAIAEVMRVTSSFRLDLDILIRDLELIGSPKNILLILEKLKEQFQHLSKQQRERLDYSCSHVLAKFKELGENPFEGSFPVDPDDPTQFVCGFCEKSLAGTPPDGIQIYDGKRVHADCYFEKLSNLIEEHPITSPRS